MTCHFGGESWLPASLPPQAGEGMGIVNLRWLGQEQEVQPGLTAWTSWVVFSFSLF